MATNNAAELPARLMRHVGDLEAKGYFGGLGSRGGRDRRTAGEIAEDLVAEILEDPKESVRVLTGDSVLRHAVLYALSFHPTSPQWAEAADQQSVKAIRRAFTKDIQKDPTATASGEYVASGGDSGNPPPGPMPKTFFGMPLDDGGRHL